MKKRWLIPVLAIYLHISKYQRPRQANQNNNPKPFMTLAEKQKIADELLLRFHEYD